MACGSCLQSSCPAQLSFRSFTPQLICPPPPSHYYLLQVDANGNMLIQSGVGEKGKSYMQLSTKKGIGPYCIQEFVDVLRRTHTHTLVELSLRCAAACQTGGVGEGTKGER